MEEDRTELNDLAAKNLPKLEDLEARCNAWAERCVVLPWEQVQAMRRG